MKGFYQKLAVATTGTILSFAVMEAVPAQAAIITYDFTVDVTSGPYAGNQYDGYFSYDDEATSEASEIFIPLFDITDFYFEFADEINSADLFYDPRQGPLSSPLQFTDGEVIELKPGNLALIPRGGELVRFRFSSFNSFDFEPNWFTINSEFGFRYQIPSPPDDPELYVGGQGNLTYSLRSTSVPEPSTAFGLGILSFGWFLKKKLVGYSSNFK